MTRCAGRWLTTTIAAASLAADTPQLGSAAERWPTYRESIRKTPGLVRLYTFEGVRLTETAVPDLAGEKEPLRFVPYKPKGAPAINDLGLTPGRWPGKQAVQLDQGHYEAAGFRPSRKAFTVECWFREHGAGSLQPRGKNGTLLAMGTGYYDGWRITLRDPNRTITFALGRPRPVFAISTSLRNFVPKGQWMHLAAAWDGHLMTVYIDGSPRADKAFAGDYTSSDEAPGLRAGFAGYGVGSFKLDVDLVALYDRALTPKEIRAHAKPEANLDAALVAAIARGDALVAQGQFNPGRAHYLAVLAADDRIDYPPLANFKMLARRRIADSFRREQDWDAANKAYAELLDPALNAPFHVQMAARFAMADMLRDRRQYTSARDAYREIERVATGKHEHYRVEAIQRLADIDTLEDGAAYVGLRQRRIDRISHPAKRFYVATNGDDANAGTEPKPFASLLRAQQAVRALKQQGELPKGGAVVLVRQGTYQLSQSFKLTAEDSGAPDAPVIYQAFSGEEVRLSGGVAVTGFKPVTDRAALARIPRDAHAHVMRADLRAQGITDFGKLTPRGYSRRIEPAHMELFFNDRPMELARWPNKADRTSRNFVPLHGLLLTSKVVFRGDDVDKDLHFVYESTRPERWANEPDGWVYGYWAVEYAATYQKIKAIDTARKVIEIEGPSIAYGLRVGRPWRALNLLVELDAPGEYYVDRDDGVLYFWPPAPLTTGRAVASLLNESLVVMQNASHVVLRGFVLEATRADGIVVKGGEGNLIAGCTLRNLGNTAVIVKGGRRHSVVGCDVYDVGNGGIWLQGGDRRTLTPAGHFAENNHLCRFSRWDRAGYRSGLKLDGVGCRASHNLIHDCPHHAVNVRYNDNVLEYNELHDICYEAAEMGSYYIWAGLDSFSWRGNVVRYNFFHHFPKGNPFPHIRTGGPGLHIDALNGHMTVYGNVFHRLAATAVFNGGGRDNIFQNNVFNGCGTAVVMGDRSSLYPNWDWPGKRKVGMDGVLRRLPYQTPPWSVRYPQLVNVLDDEPGLPKNNLVARNVNVGQFIRLYSAAKAHTTLVDNYDGNDPGFVDAQAGDLRIRPDSPVFGRIGFEPIPMDKIGLYRDELRASWPVKHEVGKRCVRDTHQATRKNVPTYRVPKRDAAIDIDGVLRPEEWDGLDRSRAMVLERDPKNRAGATPRSWAWLRCDDEHLYVGVLNEVMPDKPLAHGTEWGLADGLEVDIEGQMGYRTQGWWVQENPHGPIFMMCGNAVGDFECLPVGGLPRGPAVNVDQTVRYAAKIVDRAHWSAEYRIPFESVCIDPKKLDRRPFNIGVRKTAGPASVSKWQPGAGPAGWVVWAGTGNRNWEVWNAGLLEFAK